MSYFDNFPCILYTMDNPANNQFRQVVDIFCRVKMLDSIINNITAYFTYAVKDSDTPEIIAAKYYNDPNKHWIILFTNQVLDPYFQWPLNQEEFTQFLINKYGSVANSQSTIDHFEKRTNVTITQNYKVSTNVYVSLIGTNVSSVDGVNAFPNIADPILQLSPNNVVSFSDGSLVDTSSQLVCVDAYTNAVINNDGLRNIKLVKSDYVNQIEAELQQLLSS
jgi:hypothetical protein